MMVEVLIPDFQNDVDAIRTVVEARPDVIAHNIETTLFLSDTVRDPRANYWQSLSVLRTVKKLDRRMFTKSSIMVGSRGGRGGDEARDVAPERGGRRLPDPRAVPQAVEEAPPVKEYVRPETFEAYRKMGEEMGFRYVASGPLVRSSYRAGEFFVRSIVLRDKTISEVQRVILESLIERERRSLS